MLLGINIDHIASLRQLRFSQDPSPVLAASICEKAGADSIVIHLREDRRHIQDKDLLALKKTVQTKLNLEMSLNQEIITIACRTRPDQVTFVPEKRQELTTEGGLNIISLSKKIYLTIKKMHSHGITVSLFIEPDKKQIKAALGTGTDFIEIHTGKYANSKNKRELKKNLIIIKEASLYAASLGLKVNAGHGLDYQNTKDICKIPAIQELNIGYSIICRAVIVGLKKAVREMREIIDTV